MSGDGCARNTRAIKRRRIDNVNPLHEWGPIIKAKEALAAEADGPSLHPKIREMVLNNIAALQAFEAGYNQLKLSALMLTPITGSQPKLKIGDVTVSVRLDLLVTASATKTKPLVGGVLLHLAKGPPLKTDNAKAQHASFALHAASLVHMHVSEHFAHTGNPSYKHCFWVDVQGKEAHAAQKDYKTLVGHMRSACKVIARGWEDIEPPPGFEQRFAKYVSSSTLGESEDI